MITFRPGGGRFPTTLTVAEAGAMQAHLLYLARLQDEARLRFGGRADDATFGMVIVEAEDEAEAIALTEADPAIAAGVLTAEVRLYPVPGE